MIFFSNVSTDKNHVASRLSFIDVQALNYLLRSEIFVSEDGQLRAIHLILDYEPLSRIFQDVGQAIKAGSSRLARVDISKPRFLARRDLPQVALPILQNLPPVAQPLTQNLPEAAAFPEE